MWWIKYICIHAWYGLVWFDLPEKMDPHLETKLRVIRSRSCCESVALFNHCLGQKLAKVAESNNANFEALGRGWGWHGCHSFRKTTVSEDFRCSIRLKLESNEAYLMLLCPLPYTLASGSRLRLLVI